MTSRECETCIKRKTVYCPTSMECMATDDKPYYQNRIMLLEENQELKKQLEPNYYVKGLEGTIKEYQQEMNKATIQQKEFINYLEGNWNTTKDIWYIKILQKYKSIIGDDK